MGMEISKITGLKIHQTIAKTLLGKLEEPTKKEEENTTRLINNFANPHNINVIIQ
jgi:hypothetical protein